MGSLSVSKRLSLGFGLVLIMMSAMIMVALFNLDSIGTSNARIIEKDWVKAEAANLVNATTRANALRSFELLIAEKPEQLTNVRQHMETNKKAITQALETLETLAQSEDEKAAIAKLKDARAKYVTSFSKVSKLVDDGKKDEATTTMRTETLPALDTLQGMIAELVVLQNKGVVASGAEVRQRISASRAWLASLGAVAFLIGLAAAVLITRSLMRELGAEPSYAAAVAGKIAAGDLSVQVELRHGDRSSLMYDIHCMRESLSQIARKVRCGADNIASTSEQIAVGNLDLASRTEAQAGSLNQTAHSMEQIIRTVRDNADAAKRANELAHSASDTASKGKAIVAEVVETMGTINDASGRIADIIGVIDGIAFQTNILALNASVEAARAGVQGRGFAVVASEVRTLAQRSSTAAKEIKELIDDSVQRVNTGARLVDKAGATMEDIVTSIQRVTDLMRDISSATNKQSDEIGHVNEAVAQADAAAQQNATIVEETAAASASMQDQAVRLAETVAMFRLGDEKMAVQPRPVTLIKSEQAANEPKALLAPTRRNAPRLARA